MLPHSMNGFVGVQQRQALSTNSTAPHSRTQASCTGSFVGSLGWTCDLVNNNFTVFDQGFEPKELVWPDAEYGNFSEAILGIATAPPMSYFIPFDTYWKDVTDAPVTEIVSPTSSCMLPYRRANNIPLQAILNIKGNLSEYIELQEAAIEELKRSTAVHGACFGITSIDGKSVSVVFVGWDSVQVVNSL